MKTMEKVQKEAREKRALVEKFERMDSDANGNPRYYLAKFHVPEEREELVRAKLALSRYTGKRNGAGYVLQSYNVEADARELARIVALSEYDVQAELFMVRTGARLQVREAVPQKAPLWAKDGKHGVHYHVTLTTSRGEHSFSFWNSIDAKEKGETPSAYSILACLDVDYSEDFADFCASYGYDTDSITALKTYKAVRKQSDAIARLFTRGQLRALSEIV